MLTAFQQLIWLSMKNENLILCTTEGDNYKCWLEDHKGNIVRTLKNITCCSLVNNGKIKLLADDDYPIKYKNTQKIFCWIAS